MLSWANIASAMESHAFEFAEGKTNAEWQALGPIDIQQVADGLLLSSGNETGALLTDAQLPWVAHAARLTSASPTGAEIKFVWAYGDEEDPKTYSVSVDVPGDTPDVTSFDLAARQEWHAGKKRIGLVLPPHTTMLLTRLEFARWNPLEQFAETSASFWWMDQYRPYSINFTWGPQLSMNPVARQHTYVDVPPKAISTTFLIVLGLSALTIVVTVRYFLSGRWSSKRQSALLIIGAAFAACWLLLDMRMGMEFLTWVQHDYATYISGTAPERTFRDRDNFYDFAAFAAPLVADRASYLFFAEREWPYLGNMRYLTYPAIPGNAFDTDDTWVIYKRPDLTIGVDGQLMLNSQPISKPGTVLGRFDDGSFVFRVTAAPSAPAKP